MDVTLLGHDAKYFPLPLGLKELSSDITREVLRCQPTEIYRFIADYVNDVLLTREKAREAAIIVKDILTHDITYEAMLKRRGISMDIANRAATIIQSAYRGFVSRKLFIGRAWLTAGFDLLVYLRSRGLDPEAAAFYATKIQALYRGHVVRRIMRNTFNFAVGRDKSVDSGKELAFYLVGQGVEEDDAHDIAENVLFKYSEMAGEYATEEETDTGTETDVSDNEHGSATHGKIGEGDSLTQTSKKEGSPLPESSSVPESVDSSRQAETSPTAAEDGPPADDDASPKTEEPLGSDEESVPPPPPSTADEAPEEALEEAPKEASEEAPEDALEEALEEAAPE